MTGLIENKAAAGLARRTVMPVGPAVAYDPAIERLVEKRELTIVESHPAALLREGISFSVTSKVHGARQRERYVTAWWVGQIRVGTPETREIHGCKG